MKVFVDPSLPGHYKLVRLSAALKITSTEALGYVVRLWCWVIQIREHGRLDGIEPSEIALGAGWAGDGQAFVDALLRAGLLDSEPVLGLHDWLENQGRLVMKREAARARQQRRRERLKLSRAKRDSVTLVTRGYAARRRKGEGTAGVGKVSSPTETVVPDVLQGLELYAADLKLCGKLPAVLDAWAKAYPGVNLKAEIAKAHAWEIANPAKRKSDRIKFLNGWLGRAQDSPRPASNGGQNGRPFPVSAVGQHRLSPGELEARAGL